MDIDAFRARFNIRMRIGKRGRYIPGDSFGEIRTHVVNIPFYVTAGSRTMAIRKLLWALEHTNRCPYQEVCDRLNAGEIDQQEARRIEATLTDDDPREIAGHYDFPDEFIDLAEYDRLQP